MAASRFPDRDKAAAKKKADKKSKEAPAAVADKKDEFMDRTFKPKGQIADEEGLAGVGGKVLEGEDYDVLKAQLGPGETLAILRQFKDKDKQNQCFEISDRDELKRHFTKDREKLESFSFWALPISCFA